MLANNFTCITIHVIHVFYMYTYIFWDFLQFVNGKQCLNKIQREFRKTLRVFSKLHLWEVVWVWVGCVMNNYNVL